MDCIKLNKDFKPNDICDLEKKFAFEQININIESGADVDMNADADVDKLKLIDQQNFSYDIFNIGSINSIYYLKKLKKIKKLNELVIGIPNKNIIPGYYENYVCDAVNLSKLDIKHHFFLQIKSGRWIGIKSKTFITINRSGDLISNPYFKIQLPPMSNPEIDALITNIKLPCGIKKITLYDIAYNTFNDAIITHLDKLEELEELYICLEKFNSPMENLPLKLKILTIISNEFAQSVNTLPENLKYLYVNSFTFNNNLDCLPQGLKVLSICSYMFTHELKNLPLGLEILHLNISLGLVPDVHKSFDYLPESLVCLYLSSASCKNDLSNLPVGLEVLYIDMEFFKYVNLPPNIKQKLIK